MGVIDVRTLGLARHVVDLEREDRQAVDRPGRRLGVQTRIGRRTDLAVLVQQVGIDIFDHIRPVLVRAVDAPLDLQRLHRIDLRVADDILEVPLHRIDPAFVVEQRIDRTRLEGVFHRLVHIIPAVVVRNRTLENPIGILGKHSQQS